MVLERCLVRSQTFEDQIPGPLFVSLLIQVVWPQIVGMGDAGALLLEGFVLIGRYLNGPPID